MSDILISFFRENILGCFLLQVVISIFRVNKRMHSQKVSYSAFLFHILDNDQCTVKGTLNCSIDIFCLFVFDTFFFSFKFLSSNDLYNSPSNYTLCLPQMQQTTFWNIFLLFFIENKAQNFM